MNVLSPQLITCQPARSSPGPAAELEPPPDEGVADLGAAADAVLGGVGESGVRARSCRLVLVVVEGEGAHERAEVPCSELELARPLDGVAEDALVVVLVAVVAVDREGAAAGGQPDDAAGGEPD
jgi:hypothetical protein